MKFTLILTAVLLCAASSSSQKVSVLNSEFLPEIDQETRCGATIEADAGTLIVPNVGQSIEPGSICIFTIHLQSTNNFRLNISNLDVSGDGRDEDCSDAAVRIYSLTNLVPSDNGENYTFCNDSPPPPSGSLYLSGNLATVIYQSSMNASLNSGFTLNFEGIAFQPIQIIHESSYSSATSGLIRYPVEGEYAANRVTTWLIKTSDANPDLEMDVILQRMDIEECEANGNFSINEVCLCDALILYQVTGDGILEDKSRLCGSSEADVVIEGLGPNFIIAFFTDGIQVVGAGSGFEVLYKPRVAPPTTTPQPTTTSSTPTTTTSQQTSTPPSATPSPTTPSATTQSSTTRPPPTGNYSTECGGVLTGTQGLIEYKLTETYRNFERCLWTIRTPYRSRIRFDLNQAEWENRYDNIQIYTLNSTGVRNKHVFSLPVPDFVLLEGTVALVLFQTDYSNVGTGFSLSFTVDDGFDNSLLYFEDQHRIVEEADGETFRFPENGLYRNLELSTLTFIQPMYTAPLTMDMNITSLDLEVGMDGQCRDKLHAYMLQESDTIPQTNHIVRVTPEEGICQTTDLNPGASFVRSYGIILILATDQEGRSNGFELSLRSPVIA
ncbi:unnamed protein product [Orchesella dallaii]|uniref:CUB domain-containing protein n=1 Tax=Orchesella dallaii TaxID=48710 RepID=A0ABP1PZM7_9HEXA